MIRFVSTLVFFMTVLCSNSLMAKARYGDFTIGEAVRHKNLSIFLISGEEALKDKKILTLDQAMELNKFIVHETGSVNQLEVENRATDAYVFIQSGDIVKGGKQDRTLQNSLLIPPKSGRVKVASFCVEQGRWRKRGSEDVTQFSGSKNRVVSKELKLAARSKKSQSEVWSEVANYQHKVRSKIGGNEQTVSTPVRGTERQNQQRNDPQEQNILSNIIPVQQSSSGGSNTSLQLTIEDKEIKKRVEEYQKSMDAKISSLQGVIGFAFAINGEINSADMYASYDLFKQLWPKILESAILEAVVAEKVESVKNVSADNIVTWLKSLEGAKENSETINKDVEQKVQENESDVLYEAILNNSKKEWIHKNYIKK